MSTVTIQITDEPDGRVRTTCTPPYAELMKMIASGTQLTSAQAYAIAALNRIVEVSKDAGSHGIVIPKLYRRH